MQKIPSSVKPNRSSRLPKGFTLVELLVVMTIIAVLISGVFAGLQSARKRARKLMCAKIMRDVETGVKGLMADNYAKTPAPKDKQEQDMIYGLAGAEWGTEWLVAVISPDPDDGVEPDPASDVAALNPNENVYVKFERQTQRKNGLYYDTATRTGKLYDPWGTEIMIAVNSPKQSVYAADGVSDEILFTGGLCQYIDSRPEEDARPLACISLGEDLAKGKEKGEKFDKTQALSGSDDVTSW